jgi:hypothetical protein
MARKLVELLGEIERLNEKDAAEKLTMRLRCWRVRARWRMDSLDEPPAILSLIVCSSSSAESRLLLRLLPGLGVVALVDMGRRRAMVAGSPVLLPPVELVAGGEGSPDRTEEPEGLGGSGRSGRGVLGAGWPAGAEEAPIKMAESGRRFSRGPEALGGIERGRVWQKSSSLAARHACCHVTVSLARYGQGLGYKYLRDSGLG